MDKEKDFSKPLKERTKIMKSLKLISLLMALLLTVGIFSACSLPSNPKYSNTSIYGRVDSINGTNVTVTVVENFEGFMGLAQINPDDIKLEISTAPVSEEDVVITAPDDLEISVVPVDPDLAICTYGEQITISVSDELAKGISVNDLIRITFNEAGAAVSINLVIHDFGTVYSITPDN